MPLRTDTARRPVEQRLFTPWRCEQAPSGSTARTTCGGTTRATRASLSTFAPRTTPRACAQSRRPSGLRGGAGRTTAQRCASSSRQPASKVGPLSPRPSDWRQETWLRSAQGLGNARSLRHTVTPPPPHPPPPKVRCVASHDQRAGAQPLFCTPGAVVEEDQNPGDKTLQHRVITTTRSVQPGTSYAPFSEFPSAAKDGIPWTML